MIMLLQKSAANFVREDDLQAAIESALNQRSVYNFAVDTEGNRYVEQTDGSTKIVDRSNVPNVS